MIIKVKTLVFCDNFEYGDVQVMGSKPIPHLKASGYTALKQYRKPKKI